MNSNILSPGVRVRVTLTELKERLNHIDISTVKLYVTNRDVIASFDYDQQNPTYADLVTRDAGVSGIVFKAKTKDGRNMFASTGFVVAADGDEVVKFGYERVDEVATSFVEDVKSAEDTGQLDAEVRLGNLSSDDISETLGRVPGVVTAAPDNNDEGEGHAPQSDS